jgi:sigma-B regulation protein RsbU (phosphoserine phosphatase)
MPINLLHSQGLALRLFVYSSISSVLIFTTIIMTNYFYSKDKAETQINNYVNTIISSSVNKVEAVLNAVEKIPENLVNVFEQRDFTYAEFERLLCSTLRLNSEIYGIAIAFEPYQFSKDRLYTGIYCHRKGREIILKPFGSDEDRYFYQDWYQLARELQAPQWSEPYYEERILMSTYSVPIYRNFREGKTLIGILAVDVSLEWLSDLVLSTRVLKSGYGVLISQNGTIVTHPDKRLIMNETFFTIAESRGDRTMRAIGREMLRRESGVVRHSDIFGLDAYLYYTKIPSNNWQLLMIFPAKEMLQDITDLNFTVAALGVTGIGLLAVASILIARGITRPLISLTRTAESFGSGNLDAEIPMVQGNDEVARLAYSFASMRDSLKDYIARLTETTAAKQRIESELYIAHEIQLSMLKKIFPPFPERGELDLFAVLEPAKEVGGDFYDFFFLDEDRLFFILADVSGKGVPAALFMSVTMTLFRAKAPNHFTPDKILSEINNDLCKGNESAMFVTAFCGILNCKNGELLYANGGHIPPVIIRGDGRVDLIDLPDGLALGVLEGIDYHGSTIKLFPKDRLLCYTDGITEAMNHNKELFGSERLIDVIRSNLSSDVQDLLGKVMEEVVFFAGDVPQSDDITILCLEYKGW